MDSKKKEKLEIAELIASIICSTITSITAIMVVVVH